MKGGVGVLVAALIATLVPAAAAAPPSAVTAVSKAGRHRWSEPATWGGSVPTEGSVVRVPSGTTVVLDESPPELNGLHVDGKLVFANRDLELRTDFIMVHGKLQVGSPAKPFTHDATITLTQENRNADVMGMGGRLIGVMGGTVQLIGPARDAWTQLDATAAAGSRSIRVSEDVDWRVGDRIAIASTDYSSAHSEEAVITAVEGRTVTLDKALRYAHFGELQHYGDAVLDERAEVALLSRNIVVRGAEDSDTDGFGGQMMVEHGGDLRVRGVEFADMGQTGRLRRYPVHFHMEGRADGSYVKNSAIHHSFNRCITVHGTDGVLLADNVCFDHVGHGFFLEDGAETDNVIRGNLGFRTRRAKDPLIPSDREPATFWITNPDNTIVGNHAAGSEDFGFWYALPEHPLGLSDGSKDIWPRRTPLKIFRGNTAHSNGRDGLNVDQGPDPDGRTDRATWYEPVAVPSDEDSAPVVAHFEDFTAYKNRNRGVWLRGDHHVVTGGVFADNRAAATFASSESFLENSVVVGFSANKGTKDSWEPAAPDGRELPHPWSPEDTIYGFEFYDGRVGVSDTRFFDFRGDSMRGAGALGYLEPNAFSLDPRNYARNVTFERAERVYFPDPDPTMDGDLAKVFLDVDGSVTGTAGSTVVVNNPFLVDDSCAFRTTWNAHVCDRKYVAVMAGTLDPDPADVKPVTLTRADGVQQRINGCCDDSREAWTTALARETYAVDFAGATTKGVRFVIRNAPDDHVILKLERGPGFRVTRWGYPVAQVGSKGALADRGSSAWFYDAGTRALYIKLAGDDSTWNEIQVRPPA